MGVVTKINGIAHAKRLQADEQGSTEDWVELLVNGVEQNYTCWRPNGYELALWRQTHRQDSRSRQGRQSGFTSCR